MIRRDHRGGARRPAGWGGNKSSRAWVPSTKDRTSFFFVFDAGRRAWSAWRRSMRRQAYPLTAVGPPPHGPSNWFRLQCGSHSSRPLHMGGGEVRRPRTPAAPSPSAHHTPLFPSPPLDPCRRGAMSQTALSRGARVSRSSPRWASQRTTPYRPHHCGRGGSTLPPPQVVYFPAPSRPAPTASAKSAASPRPMRVAVPASPGPMAVALPAPR